MVCDIREMSFCIDFMCCVKILYLYLQFFSLDFRTCIYNRNLGQSINSVNGIKFRTLVIECYTYS